MAYARPRQNTPEFSLRDFYNILFRHKKLITVFFASVMGVVILVTFLSTPVYQSEAELLVRLGRENVAVDPTVSSRQIVNVTQQEQNEIETESDILKSRALAERIVDTFGAEKILAGEDRLSPEASSVEAARYWTRRVLGAPMAALGHLFASKNSGGSAKQREEAILAFMKDLHVEALKDSNIVSIDYETNDPKLAHSVLDRLVAFYLQKHINVYRTNGSYKFFKQQKSTLQSGLAQAENKLKDLKNSTGTASVVEERSILLQRMGAMRSELEETEAASSASSARIGQLSASLSSLPATVMQAQITGFPGSAADAMKKDIYELEIDEQKLLSVFTENDLQVKEIRRQIAHDKILLSKAVAQNQVTMGISRNHEQIQLDLLSEKSNLFSLQAKARTLQAQLNGAQGRLDTLNEREVQFSQLQRDHDTQQSDYNKNSESLEQARINQALEMDKISNISILDDASLPGKPVRPKKFLNLALGFFLGLFGAVGLAFLSEYQDHSFKRPEDVPARLNLPVLATLSDVSGKVLNGHNPAPGMRPAIAAGSNGEGWGDHWRLCAPDSIAAGGAIALVGCRAGEGVSTIAELLARRSALQNGGRVLIVDTNSSSPSQHMRFAAKLSPGITNLEENGRPGLGCIQATAIKNLDVLAAGNGDPELSPDAVKALAEALPDLKREYKTIICDLPPLTEHGPTIAMAALMDGVVLVVKAERTRWEVANKAKEELVQADSKILGVVLNKRQFNIPQWLYQTL